MVPPIGDSPPQLSSQTKDLSELTLDNIENTAIIGKHFIDAAEPVVNTDEDTSLDVVDFKGTDVKVDFEESNKLQFGDLLPSALEEGDSDQVVSLTFPSFLHVNGQFVGRTDEERLEILGNAGNLKSQSLLFKTTIVHPPHAPSYIIIKILIPNPCLREGKPWIKFDEFILPFSHMNCKPEISSLTRDELLNLFKTVNPEVRTCLDGAWVLKVSVARVDINTPARPSRFQVPSKLEGMRKALVKSIRDSLDGRNVVQFEIYLTKVEGHDEDFLIRLPLDIDEIWRSETRPGGPLSVYFDGFSGSHVITPSTIQPPQHRAYQPQLPPVTRFRDKEHYALALGLSRQFEEEYERKQKLQLADIEDLTARAFVPPSSRHPADKNPLAYICFIEFPKLLLSHAPQVGDPVELHFPTVSVDPRRIPTTFASWVPREYQIANHVVETFSEAQGIHDVDRRQARVLEGLHKLHNGSNQTREKMVAAFDSFRKNDEDLDNDLWFERIEEMVQDPRFDWLDVPVDTETYDSVDKPLWLQAKRIALTIPYLPTGFHAYQVSVPLQRVGDEYLPLRLRMPVPPTNYQPREFAQSLMQDTYVLNIRMKHSRLSSSYNADMNALHKLSAPETWDKKDLPSQQMVDLFGDLATLELRQGHALEDYFPIFKQIRDGTASSSIMNEWTSLSQDKKKACRKIFKTKERLKSVTGPPGTGKTHLALFIALVAMMEKTIRPDWDLDKPIDFAKSIDVEAVRGFNDSIKPMSAVRNPGVESLRILYVSGQNIACDDVLPRASSMAQDLGVPDFKVMRLYPIQGEITEMMGKTAPQEKGMPTEVPGEDEIISTITWKILNQKVDTIKKEKQSDQVKVNHHTIINLALKKYQNDSDGTYRVLRSIIKLAQYDPLLFAENKEKIRLGIQILFRDVLKEVNFILATPAACSAKFLRNNYRPHLIIFDEAARATEISFLNVVAHFSPYAIIAIGNPNQCEPLVFSEFAHAVFRIRKDGSHKVNSGVDELAKQYEKYKAILDDRPRPNTWAKQMKVSIIARLSEAGKDKICLHINHRSYGQIIDFVNNLSYKGRLTAKHEHAQGGQFEIVCQMLKKDVPNMQGQRIFVSMEGGKEELNGTSYQNLANAHFGISKALDILSNGDFTGNVIICAPYRAQIAYYHQLVDQLREQEKNSDGTEFDFDRDRLELRTHQGVQGHEASVVIVDLVRTERVGNSATCKNINVFQSRAIHGEYVISTMDLVNKIKEDNSQPDSRYGAFVSLARKCSKSESILIQDGNIWGHWGDY